ncbi:MAG TPA: hypothetical protein VFN38_10935 [Gemmatimonadaceae bacterium]|nr:hypothetical protein [Gemmatimonadaceae bacterium]
MLKRLKSHVTYANVVATMALFIALGGVSWAAVTLPRNSVGTKQIKRNAIRENDIRKGAVTSYGIKDHTIQNVDLAGGPLAFTYRREVQTNIGNNVLAEARPSCDQGERLVGGGGGFLNDAGTLYALDGTLSTNGPASSSAPVADGERANSVANWHVSGRNNSGGQRDFVGYAICLK